MSENETIMRRTEFCPDVVTRSPSFVSLTQGIERESLAQLARRKIINMQGACEALPDGSRMTESPPLKHWLSSGVYAREIHLAANTLVVGKTSDVKICIALPATCLP